MIFSNCVELYNHYHDQVLDVPSPQKVPLCLNAVNAHIHP